MGLNCRISFRFNGMLRFTCLRLRITSDSIAEDWMRHVGCNLTYQTTTEVRTGLFEMLSNAWIVYSFVFDLLSVILFADMNPHALQSGALWGMVGAICASEASDDYGHCGCCESPHKIWTLEAGLLRRSAGFVKAICQIKRCC